MIQDKIADLIVQEPQAVIEALNQAGVNLSNDASPKVLTATIIRAVETPRNQISKRIIRNVAILIQMNNGFRGKMYNFFKRKNKGGGGADSIIDSASSSSSSGGGGGWLKGLFKSQDGQPSKASQFWANNSDSIMDAGASLIGSLRSNRGQSALNNSVYQRYNARPQQITAQDQQNQKKKIGTYVLIGSLVLTATIITIVVVKSRRSG